MNIINRLIDKEILRSNFHLENLPYPTPYTMTPLENRTFVHCTYMTDCFSYIIIDRIKKKMGLVRINWSQISGESE